MVKEEKEMMLVTMSMDAKSKVATNNFNDLGTVLTTTSNVFDYYDQCDSWGVMSHPPRSEFFSCAEGANSHPRRKVKSQGS